MPRSTLLLLATALVLIGPAASAQAAPDTTGAMRTTPPSGPAARPPAPAPVAAAAPRRPRPYDQCMATARQRHYRGSERRHYVTRCQLGYGRPLFRRRGPLAAQGTPPTAPAPAPPN